MTVMNTITEALQLKDETDAVLAIREIIDTHWDYEDLSLLTEAERLFVFVENVEQEVNNGGFDQFFFNSSGDHAHDSLHALETIGAVKTAAILKKAMSIFPEGRVPGTEEARAEALEPVGEERYTKWFDACDEEYYELDENREALLLKYVRDNASRFRDRVMLSGVRIETVKPGSSAYAAGLRSGDVVVKVNDVATTTPEEYRAVLQTLKPGDKASFIVWRNGELLEAVLEI